MTTKTQQQTQARSTVPGLPRFDLDALFALQKANLETFFQAQKIAFDFVQTLTRRQAELAREAFARAEGLLRGFDPGKQPTGYVDEARAAIEKAVAEVRELADLGLRAQSEIVDLFVKRAAANLDEIRKAAA